MTRLSDTFRFPGAGEGTCASPIFFPVAMNYLIRSAVDETQLNSSTSASDPSLSSLFLPAQLSGSSSFASPDHLETEVVPDDSEFTSISMGFMDCTSDAVLVRTADLLGSLRPVRKSRADCRMQ